MIGRGEEFAAEDLRAASYSLGRLLGRVDVEDVLDVIFRDFCIGK
jgi:tRNA modification GTPase